MYPYVSGIPLSAGLSTYAFIARARLTGRLDRNSFVNELHPTNTKEDNLAG